MRNKSALAEALAYRDASFGRVLDDARISPAHLLCEPVQGVRNSARMSRSALLCTSQMERSAQGGHKSGRDSKASYNGACRLTLKADHTGARAPVSSRTCSTPPLVAPPPLPWLLRAKPWSTRWLIIGDASGT
eukprot:1194513-Prorocentrum_minimum.AAC.2